MNELKKYCKDNGVKGISNLNKSDIIKLINKEKNNTSLSPLVKWSGGKKDEIKQFIKYIPKKYDIYLEPFIGGGALYFHLYPNKAVINDVHKELIDFYTSIKKGYSNDIYEFMCQNPNEEEIYYKVRSYKPNTILENAQRFYYLRKTCFRGMLRYNNKGEFNIPYGRYKNFNFEDIKNENYEKLLKKTEIYN
jgi:DNA adenine methylase